LLSWPRSICSSAGQAVQDVVGEADEAVQLALQNALHVNGQFHRDAGVIAADRFSRCGPFGEPKVFLNRYGLGILVRREPASAGRRRQGYRVEMNTRAGLG